MLTPSRRELVAGGLDDGKVLRVVGMAATMRVPDRGPDDAIKPSYQSFSAEPGRSRPSCMKTPKVVE